MYSLPEVFIIFDTEFTSWEGSLENNWNREGEFKEMVQIAGFKVEKKGNSLEIIDSIDIIIRPKINPKLSNYFTNLTGLTQDKIDNEGISFKDGIKKFYQFSKNNNKKIKLFSYGNDFLELNENFDYYNFPEKSKFRNWSKYFFDVKEVFAPFVNVNKFSSGTIFQSFNIASDKKIDVHNSLWDSYSILISLNYLMENNKLK